MKEKSTNQEQLAQPDKENEVFKNTLTIGGEPAADKIIERIMDFPDIKRIIIFGEPGANKTTVLLQLASELIKNDPKITPNFVFYDNSLAKIKSKLGIESLTTRAQYNLVSKELSDNMEKTFPSGSTSNSRPIQFVELVGISAKNRGTSSLKEASDRVKHQNPITQDTLILGLAADSRSLKDAGSMRKAIAKLDDPLEVFDLLKSFNNHIVDFPRNIPIRETAKLVIDFFGKMASEERIKMVHAEVAAQARQVSAENEDRLFKMLRLPQLKFPINNIEAKKSYLLNAAFLQEYMQFLGLKNDMYDTRFKMADKGLVIFSPYNPNIPKNIDLSKVL